MYHNRVKTIIYILTLKTKVKIFFLNRGERKEIELVDIRVEIKLVILCAKA